MDARRRAVLAVLTAAGLIGGCSAVLGIDADRHVVDTSDGAPPAAEASVDADAGAAGWWCANDPVPDAAPGPFELEMFINDVLTASSENSFAGNPIPGASVRACSTLDVDCASPVWSTTSGDGGIAVMTVPSGFSGYYELTANGFTPSIASHSPQLGSEYVQEGMANVALIAAGGGLAGVTVDSTLATAIVSVLDCDENPAPGMTFTIGAPGSQEQLVYLAERLPSASATETDSTGSAIIYNAPPGTLRLTASFAVDHKVLRSVSTITRTGWVTFVQIRLDQSKRVPVVPI